MTGARVKSNLLSASEEAFTEIVTHRVFKHRKEALELRP